MSWWWLCYSVTLLQWHRKKEELWGEKKSFLTWQKVRKNKNCIIAKLTIRWANVITYTYILITLEQISQSVNTYRHFTHLYHIHEVYMYKMYIFLVITVETIWKRYRIHRWYCESPQSGKIYHQKVKKKNVFTLGRWWNGIGEFIFVYKYMWFVVWFPSSNKRPLTISVIHAISMKQ